MATLSHKSHLADYLCCYWLESTNLFVYYTVSVCSRVECAEVVHVDVIFQMETAHFMPRFAVLAMTEKVAWPQSSHKLWKLPLSHELL